VIFVKSIQLSKKRKEVNQEPSVNFRAFKVPVILQIKEYRGIKILDISSDQIQLVRTTITTATITTTNNNTNDCLLFCEY
jgi:hypothetical protein